MEKPASAAPSHFFAVAQVVVGILGILFSLGGFLGSVILTSTPNLAPPALLENSSPIINVAGILLAVSLLTIPSVTSAFRFLAGRPPRQPVRHKFLFASLALALVPIIILLENTRVLDPAPAWLTSITNIHTVLIPIWWLLELGRLQLTSGSAQRQWGLFTFSTFVTLPVILLVEIIVIGVGVLVGAMWVVQQPEFAPILSQLGSPASFDPTLLEKLTTDLVPLLSRPEVVAALVAGITLIVPLIEEMLKPLGVWLFHNRSLTPAEGFTLGLLSGAVFALLESLFSISAVMPGDRLYTLTGRLGTGLLHTFTAGLNGWALAATWRDGKYARVGLSYGMSVLIHGAWNFFALLMGLHTAADELPSLVNPALTGMAVWVLSGIAFLLLISLIAFNRQLRHEPTAPPLPPKQENGLE